MHRGKNPIGIKNKRQTQGKLLGGGKVEMQNQDSHFSTAPIACGARKRNCRLHKTLDAPAGKGEQIPGSDAIPPTTAPSRCRPMPPVPGGAHIEAARCPACNKTRAPGSCCRSSDAWAPSPATPRL